MADEAFQNAVQSYFDVFLKSDRVVKMVQSGACSQYDFREVFRNNIEKRVRYYYNSSEKVQILQSFALFYAGLCRIWKDLAKKQSLPHGWLNLIVY